MMSKNFKKIHQREMLVLKTVRVFCYILAIIPAMGIVFPIVIAMVADEPETLTPILRVIALALVSIIIFGVLCFVIDMLNKIILYRENQYRKAYSEAYHKAVKARAARVQAQAKAKAQAQAK